MTIYAIAKYVTGIAGALLVASLVPFVGCNQTQAEGVRCNPSLAPGETDCNAGLTCTQPSLCPENYCCPADAKGNPLPSSNPFCQAGCNGGAASMCNAGVDDAGQCAFACKDDPSDLLSSSICSSTGPGDGGGPDASGDASSTDSASDAFDGVADSSSESSTTDASSGAHEGGLPDGGTD